MPELRKDPVVGRWVVISTERGQKPTDFPMKVEPKRAEGEAKLTAAATELHKKCGATIAVTYQLPSEKAKPPKPAGQGSLLCRSVVEGLASACESDGKSAAVAKKVRAVTCRYSNAGAALRLKGGAIEASFDWNSSNLDAQVRKWVKTNL